MRQDKPIFKIHDRVLLNGQHLARVLMTTPARIAIKLDHPRPATAGGGLVVNLVVKPAALTPAPNAATSF